MANISYRGAISAIVEALEWRKDEILADSIGDDPDSVFDMLREWGYQALSEYIDNGLIYTADILELWDGSTHDNVTLECETDLMRLVTLSVVWQLEEDWADAVFDGADEWLTNVTGKDDRADALDILTGESEDD